MAKDKGKELGTTLSQSQQLERYRSCVNGVCVADDGTHVEIHLDGTDPLCAELTKLVGPKVMMGVPTQWTVDPPSFKRLAEKAAESVDKAPAAARKR